MIKKNNVVKPKDIEFEKLFREFKVLHIHYEIDTFQKLTPIS